MARSRSSGGGSTKRSSSGGFGSAPSRSAHTAAAPVQTRHAAPAATAPPPAVHQSHAPTTHAPAAAPAAAGGGLLSGIDSTIMQGMAFGGGSAIAHRAVDGIMGPRQIEHVQVDGNNNAAAQTNNNQMQPIDSFSSSSRGAVCVDETKQFEKCLQQNGGQLSQCQFYFDMLSQCQTSMK